MLEIVKQLAKEILKGDGPDRYKATVKLRNETAKAGRTGNDAKRTALAAALTAYVVSTAPKERRRIYDRPFAETFVRNECLRFLSEIASEADVKALNAVVDDLEVRDGIRRVVEAVPGDASTAVLAQFATAEEGAEFRIGAINALGKRTGEAAVKAIQQCANDPDPRIRAAAAEAFSQHSDAGLDSLIVAALDPQFGSSPHSNVNRLRLRLAGNAAKAGQKEGAEKIFRAVESKNPTPHQKRVMELAKKGK